MFVQIPEHHGMNAARAHTRTTYGHEKCDTLTNDTHARTYTRLDEIETIPLTRTDTRKRYAYA